MTTSSGRIFGSVIALGGVIGAAFGCSGEPPTESEYVATQSEELVNGTTVSVAENPATVAVYHGFQRPCTGTLLRPTWVLTARHCLTVSNAPVGPFLNTNQVFIGPPNVVTPTSAVNPGFYPPSTAVQAMRFVDYDPTVDLALVELWSPIAPPVEPSCDPSYDPYCLPFSSPPRALGIWNGESSELVGNTLRLMGYGRSCTESGPQCDEANGTSGAGTLRMGDVLVTGVRTWNIASGTGINGPRTFSGDSGGPSYTLTDRLGRFMYGLAGWHIFSSNGDGSTASFRPWIKRTTSFSGTVEAGIRPDIALVGGPWSTFHWASPVGNGSFDPHSATAYYGFDLSSFAWAAQQPGVRPVGGDFNADNRLDIALVGGGYADVQIAFAMGNGEFLPAFTSSGNFQAFAQAPGARPLSGDFNGDGRTDIALVGGSGWASIPVAWSREGTFMVTNNGVSEFASWAQDPSAKAVSGDFDGDGRDDIALTGGSGWATIPIAHSNGDGNFHVTNQLVSDFPSWASVTSKVLSGDFNGDGRDDIALTGGPGWASIPVAFSAGGGNFWVRNVVTNDFPGFAQQSGAKAVSGDFDGDGREDIALTGGVGWGSVPVAFSAGDGGFRVTNTAVGTFPSLAQASNATPFAVDGGGPRRVANGGRELVAGRNVDGRIELFYIGTNSQIYRNTQLAPFSTGWSGEIPLGGTAKKIKIAQNQDGRLEVFFIGLDDAIYHLWQTTVNGQWSNGEGLGGYAKEIAVTTRDGKIEVFYAGTNDEFYRNYQTQQNGSWSGEQYFGGAGKRVALETNLAGGLEVYVIGTDDALYRNYQSTANGSFSGWQGLGGNAREFAVGRHQDGRFQVFYVAGDAAGSSPTSLRTIYQVPGGGGTWSADGAAPVLGSLNIRARKIEMAKTMDGRLVLMYIGDNGYKEYVASPDGVFPNSPGGNALDRTLAMTYAPSWAFAAPEPIYLGWDGTVHMELFGGTFGSHQGDRLIGEQLPDQTAQVCGTANEGESVALSCPAGTVFVGSAFASYGTPGGACGTYSYGSCNSGSTLARVSALCLGRSSCTLSANNTEFGDPCAGTYKRLYVDMRCL
jgi:hypothetical protein